LNNCQYLEIIRVWYGDGYLNGKDFFKILAKYSQKNFYELSIDCSDSVSSKMLCEELEEFFINWKNHIPQKSISLTIITGGYGTDVNLEVNGENMKRIIEKYTKMGIIKKFKAVHDVGDVGEC